MTAITLSSHAGSVRPGASVPLVGRRAAPAPRPRRLRQALDFVSRAFRQASTIRELRSLDDRLLADIGIERAALRSMEDAHLALELAERGWTGAGRPQRRSAERMGFPG
jgi:uncharacterized protein YjiS (DUF1127 family)